MFSSFLDRVLPGRALRIGAGILWSAVIFLVAVHVIANTDRVRAALRERAEERLAARFHDYELGPQVEVSWGGDIKVGPFVLEPKANPPLLRVEEIAIRPSLSALLHGKLQLGKVWLTRVELHTDAHGRRLAALREEARTRPSGPAGPPKEEAPLPTLDMEGLTVVLERPEGESRRLGPFDLAVDPARIPGGYKGDVTVWLPSGGRISAAGSFTTADGVDVSVAARKVRIPPSVVPHGVTVNDGLVTADVALKAPADLSRGVAQVLLELDRLTVSGEHVSSQPVGPLKVGYVGEVRFDRTKEALTVDSSHFLLGKEQLPVPFKGKLELGPDPKLDVDLRVEPVSLQRLIATLPAQFAPADDAPHFDGPISAQMKVSGPLQRPMEWAMELSLDTSGLKQRAHDAPFALREPFSYRPDGMEPGHTLWLGPGNAGFVPLRELPSVVGQAVITSEDAGFYAHNGFDLEGIQNAFASAVDGSHIRGGSTLTQQLVKNLYLSRERTFARKLSEAFITLQLEAALPKARILEIYLNAIEWGPGVYGIADAARYYFGVDARALDAKQAAFLATIIPSPTRWGPYFRKEGLSDAWEKRVEDLLDTLHERSFISDDAYERGINERLHFRPVTNGTSLTRTP